MVNKTNVASVLLEEIVGLPVDDEVLDYGRAHQAYFVNIPGNCQQMSLPLAGDAKLDISCAALCVGSSLLPLAQRIVNVHKGLTSANALVQTAEKLAKFSPDSRGVLVDGVKLRAVLGLVQNDVSKLLSVVLSAQKTLETTPENLGLFSLFWAV